MTRTTLPAEELASLDPMTAYYVDDNGQTWAVSRDADGTRTATCTDQGDDMETTDHTTSLTALAESCAAEAVEHGVLDVLKAGEDAAPQKGDWDAARDLLGRDLTEEEEEDFDTAYREHVEELAGPMVQAITRAENRHGRDWVTGGDPVGVVAKRWIDAGFSASSAEEWMEAGGFDPDRCAELRAAGVGPDARTIHVDMGDYNATLPYAYSNGDIDLAAASARYQAGE